MESLAYKQVLQLQGDADAEATRIYAEAFNKSEEAAEFYGFLKTLETYKKILGPSTSLVLSTDSEIFGLLKRVEPKHSAVTKNAPISIPAIPLVPAKPIAQPPVLEAQ